MYCDVIYTQNGQIMTSLLRPDMHRRRERSEVIRIKRTNFKVFRKGVIKRVVKGEIKGGDTGDDKGSWHCSYLGC